MGGPQGVELKLPSVLVELMLPRDDVYLMPSRWLLICAVRSNLKQLEADLHHQFAQVAWYPTTTGPGMTTPIIQKTYGPLLIGCVITGM